MKTKTPEKHPEEPPAQRGVAYTLELSRDEIYRVVNALYHAHVELLKNQTFAIRNRGNAYASTAYKIDAAYSRLIEFGRDAVFVVEFLEKPKEAPAP